MAQVSVSTPEDEGVIDTVFVPDPGPIFLVDPAVVDSIIFGVAGNTADDWPHIQYLFYVLSTLGDGDCDNGASAVAPTKDGIKIKGRGGMTCPTLQKEISIKVCIDVRDGNWTKLACKAKAVTDATSAHKRVSTACVPGRYFYRTRVIATSVNQAGNDSYDTASAVSASRIPCAVG